MQEFDWDGNLLWEYYHGSMYMHHDIAPLPNGNILIIWDDSKSNAGAVSAGRNPSYTGIVRALQVIEIMPVGTNSANVVWEWHVWDHLIQDFDSNQENFGVVADHPELVDINYGKTSEEDWLHTNSIDYHEAFDQIILSVPFFPEIWIIDHSTTTEEAAGHSGGNSGKGGDLLYRWGNPQAYDRGTSGQKLWNQHDAHWIPEGKPGAGNILLYNNGNQRPGGPYSTVEEITPPVDANGIYTNPPPGASFGPSTAVWTYTASPPASLYSDILSAADRQPNGNTLICEGRPGNFIEVNMNGDVVWHYINPVSDTGPMTQGTIPANNLAFRADRYLSDHPAFTGRDLTPNGTLELDPSAEFAIRQAVGTASEVTLTWASVPEVTYNVQYAQSLENPVWSAIATNTAIGTLTHFTDTDPLRVNQAISSYRVVELP